MRILGFGRRKRRFDRTRRGLERLGRVPTRHPALQGLSYLVAFIVSWIGLGTSSLVYDTTKTGFGLMFLIGLMVGLPFALIVTRPLTGLLISVSEAYLLAELMPIRDGDPWPWTVIHGLVMFALLLVTCARERPLRALAGWLATAALFATELPNDIWAGWVVGVTSIAVIGALLGRLVSTQQALVVQEEVSSLEKGRRVVLEERARIARDLHDIVAHHMSLVVVQAETASYRVPDLTESARAELLAIGETARSALTETRALLSVLRQEDQAAEAAPQPGLERIGELVEAAQRAGVRLEAEVDADLPSLGAGASLAAYRIVQEALANAARHAPGALVWLRVNRAGSGVRLLVVNAASGAVPGDSEEAAGHGITGMRERAAAAGGQLKIGPTADGGFAVEVWLAAGEATEDAAGEAVGEAVGQDSAEQAGEVDLSGVENPPVRSFAGREEEAP
jgi:signal transduction histidine kinase